MFFGPFTERPEINFSIMDGIIDQFARQLSVQQDGPERGGPEEGRDRGINNLPPPPVLQLSQWPLVLDLNAYRDAHSPANPTGSYRAAYALAELADELPQLGRSYVASPYSLHDVYDKLIFSAVSETTYTQRIIANAQRKMDAAKLAGMGGISDDWYPVYASPANWYDLVREEGNLSTIVINPKDKAGSEGSGFQLVPEAGRENEGAATVDQQQLDRSIAEKVDRIELKILKVDFNRPWFDFELFERRDWWIDGVHRRYYSTGKIDRNRGIMPLVVSTMLVGVSMNVAGDFSDEDLEKMTAGPGNQINLGPFALHAGDEPLRVDQGNNFGSRGVTVSNDTTQLVGYLSNMVPVSPFLPRNK